MSKWGGAVVLVLILGYFGYSALIGERADDAAVALADIICEGPLADEAASIAPLMQRAQAAGRDSPQAAKAKEERDRFLAEVDEELRTRGVEPSAAKSFAERVKRDANGTVKKLLDLVHEGCPEAYNDEQEKIQRAVGVIIGSYATRE